MAFGSDTWPSSRVHNSYLWTPERWLTGCLGKRGGRNRAFRVGLCQSVGDAAALRERANISNVCPPGVMKRVRVSSVSQEHALCARKVVGATTMSGD